MSNEREEHLGKTSIMGPIGTVIDHTEDFSEPEDFYFESDHLALRGNKDYIAVLRTIATLQAQRIQATKDVDIIATIEREALEDPEEFVKKLASGEDLGLPKSIIIAELPKINFEKYKVVLPESPKEAPKPASTSSQDVTVRGRLFDQSKPETFNQLWTCEEQRRLEELLVEYPPEPVEMRRFAKIARALGNRTTKQVASRVQKFFKKLHSAGMPVPGRLPKSQRQYFSKVHRMNKHALRPSTFFPAHDVPVTMPEDDDGSFDFAFGQFSQRTSTANSVASFDRDPPSSNAEIMLVAGESDDNDTNVSDLNEKYRRILQLLQRVRRDKVKDTTDRSVSEHRGYECDICRDEPIIGTRWHCNTCTNESFDFCSDCFITELMSDNPHPVNHKFSGLRVRHRQQTSRLHFDADSDGDDQEEDKTNLETTSYDKDYLPSKFSKDEEYNYLDPNFLPE